MNKEDLPLNLVILDANSLNPGDLSYECLSQFGNVRIFDRTDGEEETIRRISNSEIVLVNKVPITERILSACPSIRLICVLATGYNTVDCAQAKLRGIPVCNVPTYGTASVAQFTIALLLEICHRIGYHDALVHEGKWCESRDFCFWRTPQTELAGKIFGIVGPGRIGRATAQIAAALGMKVMVYTHTNKRSEITFAEYVDFDTLLKKSDVISLHCPLSAETEKLICDQTIRKMKDGAILLNTTRGGLVDEAALSKALHSGKIRAAAVDVVSEEPMKRDNPLLTAPNCIITPHMAWSPKESRERLLATVTENIRAFLEGHAQNIVNP